MLLRSATINKFEMKPAESNHYAMLKLREKECDAETAIDSSKDLSELSNESLMKNYSKGDPDAFKELYQRHQASLYRYCVRQFRNLSIAEECYQEIWLKLIRSRNRYQRTAKFTTFLYRIAQNHIIDTYRKEKKRTSDCEYDENLNSQETPLDSNATSNNYSSAENNNLKVIALRKAIADLPFDQKNTLLLKMDNGLSIDQIAEITGCKKEAVKSRLRYATSKLKQLLQSKMHSQSEVF